MYWRRVEMVFRIRGNVRKIRRSVEKRIWICSISIFVGLFCLYSVYFLTKYTTALSYEEKLYNAEEQLQKTERMVYVAVREISAGETFTEENVVKKRVYSDEDAVCFAGEEIFTKQARLDISAGMRILTIMEADESYEESRRECTFTEISLPDTLKSGDMVDVRIQYPNGENYCVLEGKKLQRNETNLLESRLLLSEQEQLYISSALYDQTFYTGTKLYAVRYVNIPLQIESDMKYIPAVDVLQQLSQVEQHYKNKLQLREELEKRVQEN